MNASLVSCDVEEPQPKPPKDERHAIWRYLMFKFPTTLFHHGNLGFSSTKSLVYTIMFLFIMTFMLIYNATLYGYVKGITTTKMGNELQKTLENGLHIYTLP